MTAAIRTSARGGRDAKRFAKHERFTDRLYEHGALTRTTEAQERAIAEAQPCPICFTFVHPSNYEKHMAQHTTNLEVVQKPLFDYAALDTETRIVVQLRTDEIKTLMRRTAQDIIDIGTKLMDVKQRLGHGGFGSWLKAEFGWHWNTAGNYMRVADKFTNFVNLDAIAPSALYLLSAPSTPEDAVNEALERAENGETITHSTAKAIVNEHKNGATPTPEPQPEPTEETEDTEPTEPIVITWQRPPLDPVRVEFERRMGAAMNAAPKIVQDVSIEWAVSDPDTVEILTDLHANGRDTFQEVALSGVIQPGDESESCPITAGALKVRAALNLKSKIHAQLAREEQRLLAAQTPLPTGKYRCIVIDPPWPVEKIARDVRPNQDEMDYPIMTLEEIAALPMGDLAYEDGCHLYLWTTQKFLPDAINLLRAWDFNYQCMMTWVKPTGMTPYSWMYNTEHVIFGRRGNLPLERNGLKLSFEAPIVGHSVKPDVFFERVLAASPAPRLEMFARRERDGFVVWGNEVCETK